MKKSQNWSKTIAAVLINTDELQTRAEEVPAANTVGFVSIEWRHWHLYCIRSHHSIEFYPSEGIEWKQKELKKIHPVEKKGKAVHAVKGNTHTQAKSLLRSVIITHNTSWTKHNKKFTKQWKEARDIGNKVLATKQYYSGNEAFPTIKNKTGQLRLFKDL